MRGRNGERAGRDARWSLRLLHPMVPFITERSGGELNARRAGAQSRQDRIDSKPSELLIRARLARARRLRAGRRAHLAADSGDRDRDSQCAERLQGRSEEAGDGVDQIAARNRRGRSIRIVAEIEILATCRVSNVGTGHRSARRFDRSFRFRLRNLFGRSRRQSRGECSRTRNAAMSLRN